MSRQQARIGFVIGGVQKAGTTALATYLAGHPQLALPDGKEAHVFDDPAYCGWDTERIEREYERHFTRAYPGALRGDATPIYVFHPVLVQRIAAYNPAMRWILLLRDPCERALSHYAMERARGNESWPAWAALVLERWRLRGHGDDWSAASPLRRWSYRARGSYARQIAELLRHFPADQVLVVHSTELRAAHAPVLHRICGFLGVQPFQAAPPAITAFEGPPLRISRPTRALARWLLRRETREYLQL